MTTIASNWRQLQQESIAKKNTNLNVFKRLEVKLIEKEGGKIPVMASREVQNNDYVDVLQETLKGFYIGSMMVFEAYDEQNKVFYQSSPYFKNDNNIYVNDKNKSIPGMYPVAEAKNLLVRKGLSPSVKCIVVMATAQGVVTVKTNSYLWINLFNPFVKSEVYKDYLFELSPIRFNPENQYFSNIPSSYFSRLTANEYPSCLHIKQQELITSKLENLFMLDDVFQNFIDYKEHINSQVAKASPAPIQQQNPQRPAPVAQSNSQSFTEEGDGDLPF